ncbi:MAG: hypothetical protein FRX49_10960 [Trebouxia sp. A1-2]|nr:MAG: hypothetical protein FRX49_10960 [Trebouxia sp. A1-2]
MPAGGPVLPAAFSLLASALSLVEGSEHVVDTKQKDSVEASWEDNAEATASSTCSGVTTGTSNPVEGSLIESLCAEGAAGAAETAGGGGYAGG